MNIKEAEKLTGISKRNIRFYEQKGMLHPARNQDNDYRDYSSQDIERLKLIRALRMVDMPGDPEGIVGRVRRRRFGNDSAGFYQSNGFVYGEDFLYNAKS